MHCSLYCWLDRSVLLVLLLELVMWLDRCVLLVLLVYCWLNRSILLLVLMVVLLVGQFCTSCTASYTAGLTGLYCCSYCATAGRTGL